MKRFLFALWFTLLLPAMARAQDVGEGWGSWWLPPNRSKHGGQIDTLFTWIFWITMVAWILVQVTMIVFMIKYRYRKDRPKALFTHGNTRLEMIWTLVPALILAAIAVANKGVWDNFRFSKTAEDPNRAIILVIGEQFKWNVIYPGADGKLGRYLIYPKPTDTKWPDGQTFAGVKGPAYLAREDAIKQCNTYISQKNKLGKDFNDPAGKDDDWVPDPGRAIHVPVDRPVEVQLASKDVLHDFFLPNFRVKLDAVPGMRGRIYFTATMTSRQREEASSKPFEIDQLVALYDKPILGGDWYVRITKDSPGAVKDPRKDEYLYVKDPTAKKPSTIVRNAMALTKERVEQLKAAGIQKVTIYKPGYWDLVCEELCGQGHYQMAGQLIVLDQDAYKAQFETKKTAAAPATAPAVASK